MDYDLLENGFLSFDARWIDIDATARFGGTSLGDLSIDPMTYGISFGWRLASSH